MLIVLAKLGTPEGVGQFSLGLAVTAPVVMLTNLQLRAIQATDARREFQFADYLALRLGMTALALAIIVGIAFLSGYEFETALVVLIIGVGKCFDSISDVYYGMLQQYEQMDRVAKSFILKGVLSLLALTAGMVLTRNVIWAALGWSLASLVVVAVYDLRTQRALGQRTPGEIWLTRASFFNVKKLAWVALPLGITMMLVSLNVNIPRYFLQSYSGTYAVGIYSAMAYLTLVGNTVIVALGQAASPRFAAYHATANQTAFHALLRRLLQICLLGSVAGVLLAIVWGEGLLNLLYGTAYGSEADVFVQIVIAGSIGYFASLIRYVVIALRALRIQLFISGTSVIVTLVTGFLIIPNQGLNGIGVVLITTEVVSLFLLTGVLLRLLARSSGRMRPAETTHV